MSITTQKFERKPFYVEAVRVTAENLAEVAEWCGGNLTEEGGKRYVDVDVHMPLNERQTKAFPGDWVLKANKGFKVYQNKSFWATFVRSQEATPESIQKLAEAKNSREVNRSAKSGQFVTEEEAEANPDTTVTETVAVPQPVTLAADAGLGEKSDKL